MDDQRNIPVYPHSALYASEHGEVNPYMDSYCANLDCVAAIREAVNKHYDYGSYHFDTEGAAKQVIEQFGLERALYVLANTVREKAWDGRISHDNIEWAKSYPVADDVDTFGRRRNTDYIVDAVHPGLTNMLVKEMRKQAEREQKPSIRGQLAAARPEQNEKPAAKSKCREEAR